MLPLVLLPVAACDRGEDIDFNNLPPLNQAERDQWNQLAARVEAERRPRRDAINRRYREAYERAKQACDNLAGAGRQSPQCPPPQPDYLE